MAGYEIEVIKSERCFADVQKRWQDFERGQRRLYFSQAYNWLTIWWETFKDREDQQFGYNKELLIILMLRHGEIAAIAPFIKLERKKFGLAFSFIEFLGQQWGCTFMDVVGDNHERESWQRLISWLYSNVSFDVLNLAYLPEGSPILQLVAKANVFPLSACPFIELGGFNSFEEYSATNYSAHHRHNLRTRGNRLKRDGLEWQFVVEKASPEVEEDVFRLSASKLVDGKTSIYLDADKRKFMLRVLKDLTTDVAFIRVNGQAAAYRLNTYFRDWKICLDSSFDREYSFYGMGVLSLDRSIENSFARRLSIHCEGTGPENYKLDFTKRVIPIYDYLQAGNTLLSPLVLRKLVANEKRRARENIAARGER